MFKSRVFASAVFFACATFVAFVSRDASAQSVVSNMHTLQTTTYTDPYVVLQGYYTAGDGGGGIFISGASGCTDNSGTVILSNSVTCYYRASSTGSAREFGAYCDVQPYSQSGSYAHSMGTMIDLGIVLPHSAQTLPIVIYNIGVGPWSLLETSHDDGGGTDNHGSYISAGGAGYSPGDTPLLIGGTATVQAQIVVDSIGSGGSIASFHFLLHGSYTVLPSSTLTVSGGTANATMTPFWSGASFAGTLATVSGTSTTVTLNAAPGIYGSGLTATQALTGWYYGHDDNIFGAMATHVLQRALDNLAAGNMPSLVLPGNCGITLTLSLPNNNATVTVPPPSNPSIMGLSNTATGLYALGAITGNLVNKDTTLSRGGGLSNMTLEGGGLTTGAVLEVDGGNGLVFDNLHVRDALGKPINGVTGNPTAGASTITSVSSITGINAGVGISDLTTPANIPAGATVIATSSSTVTLSAPATGTGSGDTLAFSGGNTTVACRATGASNVQNPRFSDMLVETDSTLFSGAQFPDDQILVGSGCLDAFFLNDTAINATLQEIYAGAGGGRFVQPHTYNTLWPDILSGSYPVSPAVSQHGITVASSAQLAGAIVDNASLSNVYITASATSLIGAHLDCGNSQGVATGFVDGVELAPLASYDNVTGVTVRQSCFTPQQLIVQDGGVPAAAPSTQVSANSGASYIASTRTTLPQGRLSLLPTQPVPGSDVNTSFSVYYLPYQGPSVAVWNGAVMAGLPIGSAISANVSAGQATITNVSNGNAIFVGMPVSGPGIPTGTSVSAAPASPSPISVTGNAISGNVTIHITGSLSAVLLGEEVTDGSSYIPAGAIVIAIDTGANNITISLAPTGSNSADSITITGGTTVQLTTAPTATNAAASLFFSGILLTLDNTNTDTLYQANSNIYDIYIAQSNSGAPMLCTGPQWSNSTPGSSSRGTYGLTMVNGIWVNSTAMPCRLGKGASNYMGASGGAYPNPCQPYYCTYVGSLYATNDGRATMQMGPNSGNHGACNMLGLYNAYDQVPIVSRSLDTEANYGYTTATWRPEHNNYWTAPGTAACNAIAYLDGLGNLDAHARLDVWALGGSGASVGLDFNSTTATPTSQAQTNSTTGISLSVPFSSSPVQGVNFAQGMELGASGATFANGSGYQTITLQIND